MKDRSSWSAKTAECILLVKLTGLTYAEYEGLRFLVNQLPPATRDIKADDNPEWGK